MRDRNRSAWIHDRPRTHSPSALPRTTRLDRVAALRRLVVPVVVGMLLALVATTSATARETGSSLRLKMVDPTDSVPNVGDQVTFDITTPAAQPYVNVRCYQGEAFVYDAWAAFFQGGWFGRTFALTSTYWQSGDAECRARLVKFGRNGGERVLATTRFQVYA